MSGRAGERERENVSPVDKHGYPGKGQKYSVTRLRKSPYFSSCFNFFNVRSALYFG